MQQTLYKFNYIDKILLFQILYEAHLFNFYYLFNYEKNSIILIKFIYVYISPQFLLEEKFYFFLF